MLCKFVLIIDEVSYELSNSAIKNWKEVSYSLKRTDYSGITRTFTSKFEFINDAYDLLLSEYRQQYLMAAAMIEVYTVTNNTIPLSARFFVDEDRGWRSFYELS